MGFEEMSSNSAIFFRRNNRESILCRMQSFEDDGLTRSQKKEGVDRFVKKNDSQLKQKIKRHRKIVQLIGGIAAKER